MKIFKLTAIIFLIIYSSCKDKKNQRIIYKEDDSASYYTRKLQDTKLMDSLAYKVIKHGDTMAYKELRIIHSISGNGRGVGSLYYSLIMANQYNFKEAYYDIYIILYPGGKEILDKKTKALADEYLKKYNEFGK